jgi:hypothetical protein
MRRELPCKFLFALFCFSSIVDAQPQRTFKYVSALNQVKSAGFYQVVLTPEIVAKCVDVSKDIRILNAGGQQVPFILRTEPREYRENNFVPLPILSVTREADKQTHVIASNEDGKIVRQLLLEIKNTDANRSVTISGSDDKKAWFVIKENLRLSDAYSAGNDRTTQLIEFPPSSYRFFDIIINGKNLLPVNIVRAGLIRDSAVQTKLLPLPAPTFVQRDSNNNISYITVRFNEQYLINRVDLSVVAPKFFRRTIYVHNKPGRSAPRLEFDLRSDAPPGFNLDTRSKELFFEIQNEDNPPLELSQIRAYQHRMFLLAYLEPAMSYRLVFGDSTARPPRYDLEHFKDSLRNIASVVETGPIAINIQSSGATKQASKSANWLLWLIMGAALAALLLLTFQLTKQVSSGKT